MAGQAGAVATRSEDQPVAAATEPVFTPKDFRLDLRAKLAVAEDEPLSNLDSPAIRKLTWEHVVPDRPASSAPSAAALVPLPPPSRVPPPPSRSAVPFEPPALVAEVADDDLVAYTEPMFDELADAVVIVEESPVDDDEIDVLEAVDELEAEDPEPVVAVPVVAQPVVPQPVVVAEPILEPVVNRLGSVPDLIDDDDSPIELPPITPSGPIVAHAPSVYTPVLAETLYVVAPRPATTTVAADPATGNAQRKKKQKPKRHLFRSFVTLVLLFGLLAGGAFAAKKYLLHPPTWSAELKPLADEVAATRGLEFKEAVDVTSLPVADYATRLAQSALGTGTGRAATWRALGLLNGDLDFEAIGRQALNDNPAVYDPTTQTILVSDDLQAHAHLYRFAMHRAMTVALLDQQFDWGTRVTTATPAAALAIRSTIDADALAVANSLATKDSPEQLAPELLAFVQGHGNTIAPSQFAATIAGRAGVAVRPTIASLVADPASIATLEQAIPTDDALFDFGRPASVLAAPAGTQGMMFWYYVLASRIDDGQAWLAVTHWTADSIVTSTGATNQCVDAKIAANDADGAALMLAAFETWAITAPGESTTTVVAIDGNQVAVRACDPTAAISAQVPTKIPVVFGGAGVERALVEAADSAAGGVKVDAVCLVAAARQRVPALTSPADDAPVLAIDWQPAFVAANLDLATGCVASPPDPVATP